MENNRTMEVLVEPDYEEYRRILYERSAETLKNNRLGLGVEFTAVVIWLFNTFLLPDFDGPTHRAILVGLCVFFALHIFAYLALVNSIRSQARKWTGKGDPITYTLSPEGIRSSSTSVTWESPWSRFVKVVETESDLLFIVEGNDFVPIPKRFVSDQGMLDQLRRLISSNATGAVELMS